MQILEPKLEFRQMVYKRRGTSYVVVHHAAADSCTIEDVHRWHLERGWAGCGYHYFVNKRGEIYRGRPEDAVGAHCVGYNDDSIGICLEGNFDTGTNVPTGPQLRALVELLRYLKQKYPGVRIVRHKDLAETSCPGKNFPWEALVREMENGAVKPEVEKEITVRVGTKILKGYLIRGQAYAPVRALVDALNHTVAWDEAKQEVVVN